MRAALSAFLFTASFAFAASACEGTKQDGWIKWDPRRGAGIDRLLPNTHLSGADRARVQELRSQVAAKVAANDSNGALDAEKKAMDILGYEFRTAASPNPDPRLPPSSCLEVYWVPKMATQ
jgi:hypothetical protein